MEVKFAENSLHCMKPLMGQLHKAEQTAEVRIPDSFPDIGRILGSWGQVLIRGKEWRSGAISASGGVMAWVLYAPEDGTTPKVVDCRIPLQSRWDLQEDSEDGIIQLRPVLSELDARSLSARKMLVRANVETYAGAMVRQTVDLTAQPTLPEDVQVLKRSYPGELPMEAGEKQVQLEEAFTLPGNLPGIHKLVYYNLKPSVTEHKVLGDRLVFRGKTDVDLAYLTEEGTLHYWNDEFPFSQYTQLDRDYSPNASAWVFPVLTAMELDLAEGQLRLKGAMAAQYTIFDREIIEFVEDAFSPIRDVSLKTTQLQLPMLLDRLSMELPLDGEISAADGKLQAATAYCTYPTLKTEEMKMMLEGHFMTISEKPDGQLWGESVSGEGEMPIQSAPENQHFIWLGESGRTNISAAGEGYRLSTAYPVTLQVYSGVPVLMVTELELGEAKEPDANRPSIILRRVGEEGLWELAKKCGATVDAIQEANKLTEEPEIGQLLLIPVS